MVGAHRILGLEAQVPKVWLSAILKAVTRTLGVSRKTVRWRTRFPGPL